MSESFLSELFGRVIDEDGVLGDVLLDGAEEPQRYEFDESQHPRADDGRFGVKHSGPLTPRERAIARRLKRKAEKKAAQKEPETEAEKKPAKPTVDEINDHISRLRADPTTEGVKDLAASLMQLSRVEIDSLKKSLGLRAGGAKAALAEKVAKQATARVSVREKFVREARQRGYKAGDLSWLAQRERQVHEEVRSRLVECLQSAREKHAHYNDGQRLTRSLKAFKGNDFTYLGHWDETTTSLQEQFPDVLGEDERDAMNRLYDLVNAGPPKRMAYEESYQLALEQMEQFGPPKKTGAKRKKQESEEPIPFARAGKPKPPVRADLDAILAALLDAAAEADEERLAVLVEMLDEPEEEADEDETTVDEAAAGRIADLVREMAATRRQAAEEYSRPGQPHRYEWEETKHPRADDGKFGAGSGSGSQPSGNSAQRRKAKRQQTRQGSDPASPTAEPTATEPAGKFAALVERAKGWLTPRGLAAKARALCSAVAHPIETAAAGKQAAIAKYADLKQKYGTSGALTIAAGYVGYYTAASMNPAMLTIPVPLTATLITTAKLVRWAEKKIRGIKDAPLEPVRNARQTGARGLTVDRAIQEVKILLESIAKAHGEKPPQIQDDLMRAVLHRMLGQAGRFERQGDPSRYAEFVESEHPRDRGQFAEKPGGEAAADDADADDADAHEPDDDQEAWDEYTAEHAAWEKETAALEAAHAEAVAEWKQKREAFAAASAQYDADYTAWETRKAERAVAHDEAAVAQEARADRRAEQKSALDDVDFDQASAVTGPLPFTPTLSGEPEKDRAAAQSYVTTVQKQFLDSFGSEGYLGQKLAGVGLSEKAQAALQAEIEKGLGAMARVGEKYLGAVGKFLDFHASKIAPHEQAEPEEPGADVPAEERDEVWEAAYEKWEAEHEVWETQQEKLSERADELDSKATAIVDRMDSLWTEGAEKLEKVFDRVVKQRDVELVQEEKADPEPEEPDDEPEPEAPTEPEEEEPEEDFDYPEEPEPPE